MHTPDKHVSILYPFPNGEKREVNVRLLDERQAAIYRTWTPAQRMKAADDQMRFYRSMMAGVIRGEHPDWSDEEVRREIARRLLGDDYRAG